MNRIFLSPSRVSSVLILVGCALLASSCSSTADEPLPPGSLPPAPEDAVFGLSWEYTEEELINGGVIEAKPEPFRGDAGRMYTPARLPRRFEDTDWSALFFNDRGELLRIACVGETMKDDPDGIAIRERYEELKEIISRRIPIVGVFEAAEDDWADYNWWPSLKEGRLQWATGFRGNVMEAVLEIRAESDHAGSYSLIVDHLPRMQQFNRAADAGEESVF